jgi:hypothetical protein
MQNKTQQKHIFKKLTELTGKYLLELFSMDLIAKASEGAEL